MSEPRDQLLLVEDETAIRRSLSAVLVQQGFAVIETGTVREALLQATTRNPDLYLIDLGLPDGDGIDLVKQLRTWCANPILIVSARGREEDKVAGLEAGADDYLAKPFGVAELLARVRAALRRRTRAAAGADGVLRCGELSLDPEQHRVERAGAEVHLTPLEFKLLQVLMQNAGRLVQNRQLLTEVWGPKVREDAEYLRVYIHHLRRKIEDDAAQPRILLTDPGIGYRLIGES